MMQLRPYQLEAVDAVYRHLKEKTTNPCVVIPTAGGKSLVLGRIASDAASRWHGRVLILAHVKELLEQNAEKVRRLCPELPVGIYSAGLSSRDTTEPVIVAGIQSVYQRAEELGAFDLVIVDEAHTIPPDGEGRYRTFLAASKALCPHQRVIGFTATPYRVDGGLICKPENILNEICYEVGIPRLISEGYISRLTAKAGKSTIDLSDLHVRAGEFVQEDVEKAVANASAVSSACKDIAERTRDRKSVIVFCSSVAHCHDVAGELHRLTGARAEVVTGETPSNERAGILSAFKGNLQSDLFGNAEQPIKYLCNMGVLTTGFDAPNIDCVVLLRPTKSPGLFAQMVGRAFRLSPETGKSDALVLDYGGNIVRHGPVDAITVREQRPSGQQKEPPRAKECPACGELVHPAVMKCPACGFDFPRQESALDAEARNGGILTGEKTYEDFQTSYVEYAVHHKKNEQPGDHPTVEVTYFEDMTHFHREWLCVEHEGYARKKFERWWFDHARRDVPPPATCAECVALCRDPSVVKEAEAITVCRTAGEKWPRVTGWFLKPLRPPRPAAPVVPDAPVSESAPDRGDAWEPETPADDWNDPLDDLPF